MNLSRFATHHIKAILFVTVALCVIGAWLLGSFPVAILPDITFPRIVVIAESGERPAKMMEVGVTRLLEESIASVPGVSRMRSKTERGATQISVDLGWGTDMLIAQQLVNTKVNEIRADLPADTHISVERMNPTVFPILGFSLRAKGLSQAELWSLATYTVKPRLTRVPGVARVVVQGGRIPEIAVEVNPQKLAAHQLALADVEAGADRRERHQGSREDRPAVPAISGAGFRGSDRRKEARRHIRGRARRSADLPAPDRRHPSIRAGSQYRGHRRRQRVRADKHRSPARGQHGIRGRWRAPRACRYEIRPAARRTRLASFTINPTSSRTP